MSAKRQRNEVHGSHANKSPSNGPCSVYPQHPPSSRLLLRVSETAMTKLDRCIVAGSSLFIVGSFAWAPLLCSWAWRKWKAIPKEQKRRRAVYATVVFSAISLVAFGPHRSPRAGKWLKVRKWKLWDAWMKFIAMEVIADQPQIPESFNAQEDKAILAFVPHGIFPFAFAFGVFPDIAQRVFGFFHPVVATATKLFPFVRDFLKWAEAIDASRGSVDNALAKGKRIGLVPGGIAEMFEGYPKPSTLPNEEYSIVRRGFLRMAAKHGVPVLPIYCFGATKMFKRVQLPVLEKISLLIRVSICAFFGVWGLPIPFRQKLSYVIGQPIFPPNDPPANNAEMDTVVDDMHRRFCDELLRLFENHKDAYGWSHKTLKLIKL